MDEVSFFISANINTQIQLEMLKKCIRFIRKYYKNEYIYIIDDDSKIPITDEIIPEKKIHIINCEYKHTGEMSRLYYYWKYHPSVYAILLHDSTFLNTKILKYPDTYKFFFSAGHLTDNIIKENQLISNFDTKDKRISKMYNRKDKWHLCFGIQMIIKWKFLEKFINTYPNFLPYLMKNVKTRDDRMRCERVVACAMATLSKEKEDKNNYIYGDLRTYIKAHSPGHKQEFGTTYQDYIANEEIWNKAPIIKIFVGR